MSQEGEKTRLLRGEVVYPKAESTIWMQGSRVTQGVGDWGRKAWVLEDE